MTDTIDPRAFRETLGHYPTGVTAITAFDEENRAIAMIVGTFTSVSLDPPLVAFLPTRSSSSFARLRSASRFAINVLAHDQESLCRRLARSDPDKMANESWTVSESGLPVLDDIVTVIECEQRSITEAGDHYIVLGEVTALRTVRPTIPLLFFRGGYGGFTPSSIVVSAGGGELASAALQVQALRDELESAAAELGGELTIFARIGQDSVAVASATAPGVDRITALGTRYPLVPPLGVPLVAWGGATEQETWIDRAVDATDDERAELRRHLDDARSAGWSLSLHETPELDAPLVSHGGEGIDESERRDVWRRRIIRAARYFDVALLEDSETYDVGAVMAPILPATDEAPSLMARLLLFPRARLTGAQVAERGAEIRDFAARASGLLAAAPVYAP